MTALSPAARPRLAAIDIARGIAIVAMVIYHFSWDLAYLRFADFDPTQSWPWIVFQKSIVGTFIFLTGVSLTLAHGEVIRWRAFWKRFAIIGGAALVVTVGTYAFSPATFVYFGVLHAIAVFSLLGRAFLTIPLALVAVLGVVLSIAPVFVSSPIFATKPLSWIGLFDVPPPSEDLVPVLPWFGVALLGIAATRWALSSGFVHRLAAIKGTSRPAKVLSKMGRWSLVIYLLHQPILLGALMGVSSFTGHAEAQRADNFIASCQASCSQSAPDADYCTAYCTCALNRIVTEDLWGVVEAETRSSQEETMLISLTNQCAAQVLDEQMLEPQE